MKPGQVVVVSLAGGCALLATVGALLLGGVGQEIAPAPPLQRADWVPEATLEGDEFALPPLETYAEVTARPLFNEDRQPAPPDTDSTVDEDGPEGEQPPVDLNVTVTGIIITPEKKVAMVLDNVTKQQLRLSEGMPLEGEQSSWTLASIEARRLVFDGGGPEPMTVELETYTRALKGGAPSRARARATAVANEAEEKAKTDAAAAQATTASEDDRAARAEEIRRRVAERRAQLREEAERRRQEQQQENDND